MTDTDLNAMRERLNDDEHRGLDHSAGAYPNCISDRHALLAYVDELRAELAKECHYCDSTKLSVCADCFDKPTQRGRARSEEYVRLMDERELLRLQLQQAQAECARLTAGRFTSEEFQNLCHTQTVQDGFDAFADGCEEYQQQLFGRCRRTANEVS